MRVFCTIKCGDIKMKDYYNKIKYFEQIEKIPSQIYYHYTSLEALYNIISSKTFRLTSLKSSNDKKELFYKPDMFLYDLEKIITKETDDKVKEYFKLVKKSIELNRTDFLKSCKAKTYPYALCLSEKKDNLTHWDRYASNCTGVCIGFNVSALRVLMQRMTISTYGIGVYDIGKVLYSLDQKESVIRSSLLNILYLLCEQVSVIDHDIIHIIQKNGYAYAVSAYLQIAKFVKDKSFVDEDEVRLYHESGSIKDTTRLIEIIKPVVELEMFQNLKKNFEDFVTQLHLNEEKFYISSKGIRSYKELCLEKIWGSGTITEIMLGPMCIQNRNELKHFLKANGLVGTKVSVSSVPIR